MYDVHASTVTFLCHKRLSLCQRPRRVKIFTTHVTIAKRRIEIRKRKSEIEERAFHEFLQREYEAWGRERREQLEEDLRFYRETKPLPEQLLWEVDRVHMRNRLPIFASTRVGKDWEGEGEIGEPIP